MHSNKHRIEAFLPRNRWNSLRSYERFVLIGGIALGFHRVKAIDFTDWRSHPKWSAEKARKIIY